MFWNNNNEKKYKKGQEIENKTEKVLTLKEKELIIKTLEESKQQLKELKRNVQESQKDKEIIIALLQEIQEMIDIEQENGKPYTKEDYKKMSNSELMELCQEALEYSLEQFKNYGDK